MKPPTDIIERARLDALPRDRTKFLRAGQGFIDPCERTIPSTRDRPGLAFVVVLLLAIVVVGVLWAAGTGVGQ